MKRDDLFGLSRNAKDRLLSRMQASSGRAQPFENGDADPLRFDLLPGFRAIRIQAAGAAELGVSSPYFRVHDATAGARTVIGGREVVNFASYDYLDLNSDPRVQEAAIAAIRCHGTSVSASRLVSGERQVQRQLEDELASFLGTEGCVVMVSGHATNVTTIAHLMGPRDLVVHDLLAHNSIIQGAEMSAAHRLSFPHNDWQALDEILARHRSQFARVLVILEGLYSMDGDLPHLPSFVEVKRRHRSWLMVDEAHSIGVVGPSGRGISELHGVEPGEIDLWMGTLSKSLAGCGGFIAGARDLIDYLKFSAPGFVYSVGISPPLAAASLAALRVLIEEPERVAVLRERSKKFAQRARAAGLDTGASAGYAITPVIVGRSSLAVQMSHRLLARGFNVAPVIPPAVPERSARLRFFISCAHSDDDSASAVEATVKALVR